MRYNEFRKQGLFIGSGVVEAGCRGDNVCGIMTKSEWVPKEISFYQKGSSLWFYVSKVLKDQSVVTVYLSRGSKNLPAALLREKLP